MEATDVPRAVPALATERRFAQRLRECLEEEQLLDGRYQLQQGPGRRVALPVLEEKLSRLRLPPEVPCERVWIQDPVPSRAARRRTPAQKLRDELRRLLGGTWSEELERDVPHAWQRHGDLVLLSEDSFKAAPWERLGEGEQGLPAPVLPAGLPAFPSLPGRLRCRLGALGDGRLSFGGPAGGQERTGDAGWVADPPRNPAAGPGWLGGARGQRDQVHL